MGFFDFLGDFGSDDELDDMKRDDSYHFSFPFEYIEKNHGSGNYDMATATMDVDLEWDDYDHGYRVSISCDDEYLIDPSEGNGSLEEFYNDSVYHKVMGRLQAHGIPSDAVVSGGIL